MAILTIYDRQGGTITADEATGLADLISSIRTAELPIEAEAGDPGVFVFLRGADLATMEESLAGATLWNMKFNDADLSGLDLSGCDARGSDFNGAKLTNADFSGADLRGADLHGCEVSGADFTNADLRGARLFRTNISEAVMDGANLENADLVGDPLD